VKRPKVELTPRQHDVLARYTDGQTARSIGADLGIHWKTVREQIHRARERYVAAGLNVSTKIALRDAYQRNTAPRP
jgi:DNA-binding NarL/FixJ family response regulator